MKFLSPHFPQLRITGAGTFFAGELVIPDVDRSAIAKVRAVAETYGITQAEEETPQPPVSPTLPALQGVALNEALQAAGLSTSGRAQEKRARLAAYLALHPAAELGQPAPATAAGEQPPATPPVELKGAALDAALRDADLPLTGTADDKRARLAAHQAGDAGRSEADAEAAVDSPAAETAGPVEGALSDAEPATAGDPA